MATLTSVISTAAKASRAAAANAGRLFLPNNGFSLDRDTGAAWAEFGPLYAFTTPSDGSFSWLNQGAATVDTTNGAIALTMTNADGNLHIRHIATPATPYTITAAFLYLLVDNNARCGLCWDDGTKVHTFGPQAFSAAPNQCFGSLKWTGTGTFSAAYTPVTTAQPVFSFAGVLWLRVNDNGTNRICSFSHDGQHWMQYHSVTRTDFLTPTSVGYFIEASGAASYGSAMTLLSWQQS